MQYLGSKRRLIPFIFGALHEAGVEINGRTVVDAFAGTGVVSAEFRSRGALVTANDLEPFSQMLCRHLLQPVPLPAQWTKDLTPLEGFITQHYSPRSKYFDGIERRYFTEDNARKIDGARALIDSMFKPWDPRYPGIMTGFILSTDRVANTASTYATYLKSYKATALKEFKLQVPPASEIGPLGLVYGKDALQLPPGADIAYLDPPYNHRQYSDYFHLLNTLIGPQDFAPSGVGGMPPLSNRNRSIFCSPKAPEALTRLIQNLDARVTVLSYNSEGIIPIPMLRTILGEFGAVAEWQQPYPRFTQKPGASQIVEHLFIVKR